MIDDSIVQEDLEVRPVVTPRYDVWPRTILIPKAAGIASYNTRRIRPTEVDRSKVFQRPETESASLVVTVPASQVQIGLNRPENGRRHGPGRNPVENGRACESCISRICVRLEHPDATAAGREIQVLPIDCRRVRPIRIAKHHVPINHLRTEIGGTLE